MLGSAGITACSYGTRRPLNLVFAIHESIKTSPARETGTMKRPAL